MRISQLRFCAMIILGISSNVPYAMAKGGICDYTEYEVPLRGDFRPTGVTGKLSWVITKNNQANTNILNFDDTKDSFIKKNMLIIKNGYTIQENLSAERTYHIMHTDVVNTVPYKGQYKMVMTTPGNLNSNLQSFKFELNSVEEYPIYRKYSVDIDWDTKEGHAFEDVEITHKYNSPQQRWKRLNLTNCQINS